MLDLIKREINYYRLAKKYAISRNGGTPYRHYLGAFYSLNACFVHIPKTAGSSIAHSIFGMQIPHLTHSEICQQLPISKLRRIKSFTFVRNPIDRLASAYFYLDSGGNQKPHQDVKLRNQILHDITDLNEFVLKYVNEDNYKRVGFHLIPQIDWLDQYKNKKVDFVGRFERLEEDHFKLCNLLGIESTNVEKSRVSKGLKSYSNLYTKEALNILKQFYLKDFELYYPEHL